MALNLSNILNIGVRLSHTDPQAYQQLIQQFQILQQNAARGTAAQVQAYQQAEAELQRLITQIQSAGTASNQAGRQAASAFGELGNIFDNLKGQALAFTGALAGVGAIGGIAVKLAEDFSKYARSLEDTSRAGNISRESAAGLILALEQIGADANDAQQLLSQFTSRLSSARNGSEDAEKGFRKLGISFDDLKKLKPEEIFSKITSNLKNLKDQEQAIEGLSEIFGDDDAIKITKIADSLDDATEAAKKLGLVLTDKEIAEAAGYTAQIRDLEAQWKSLSLTLGKEVVPALSAVAEAANVAVTKPGSLVVAIGEAVGDYVAQIGQDFKAARELSDQFNKAIEGEASRTGSNFAQTLAELSPLIGEVSESLGVAFVETTVFTNANREALETVKNNIALFKEAARVQGISTESVLRLTGGNIELAKALIEQSGEQRKAIDLSKQRAASAEQEKQRIIELTAANAEATKQSKEASDAEKLIAKEIKNRTEAQELAAQVARRAGVDEITIARERAAVVIETTQAELDAADAVFEARKKQIEATYQLELKRAGNSKEAITEAAKTRNEELAKAQVEYDEKAIKAAQEREKAIEGIEKASAERRARDREKEFAELERNSKRELELIDRKEEQGRIRHATAAEERSQVRRNELAEQQRIINEQLAAENVGIEERKKLQEQLRSIEKKLRDENLRSEIEANDAAVKDAERAVAEKTAALTKQQAFLEQGLAAVEASGASEIQKAEAIAELKQRQIALEIQKVQIELDAARSVGAAKEKIIELEIRLIGLGTQSIQVANELGEAYKNAGLSAEEAAKRAKVASEANLGAILGFINGLVTQANSVTRENIDEVMGYLEERVREASLALGNVGPQVAGLFEFYSQKANEALQKARQKEAEFQREDAARAAEERQREAERRAQEEAAIRDRAFDAERDALRQLAEAQADYRQGVINEDVRWLKERQSIIDQGNDRVAAIESDWSERRIERAKEEFERLRQIEENLQNARNENINDSRQNQADDEFSRTDRELKAQRELEEAKKKGDPEAIKKAQAELDSIAAERDRANRRANEERLARERATSAEELEILLNAISEKYEREENYYDAVAELGENASAEELARLKKAYDEQLAAIEAAKNSALNQLIERLAKEKEAREKAAEEEDQDFRDRLDAQKEQNAQQLATAEQGHRDRLTALKKALQDEKTEFAARMAEIRANLEEELARMAKAWSDYAGKANDAIGGINTTSSGSGGDGKDEGGGTTGNTTGSTPSVGDGPTGNPGNSSGLTNNGVGGGSSVVIFANGRSGSVYADSSGEFVDKVIAGLMSTGGPGTRFTLAPVLQQMGAWVNGGRDRFTGEPFPPKITREDYNRLKVVTDNLSNPEYVLSLWRDKKLKLGQAFDMLYELIDTGLYTEEDWKEYAKPIRKAQYLQGYQGDSARYYYGDILSNLSQGNITANEAWSQITDRADSQFGGDASTKRFLAGYLVEFYGLADPYAAARNSTQNNQMGSQTGPGDGGMGNRRSVTSTSAWGSGGIIRPNQPAIGESVQPGGPTFTGSEVGPKRGIQSLSGDLPKVREVYARMRGEGGSMGLSLRRGADGLFQSMERLGTPTAPPINSKPVDRLKQAGDVNVTVGGLVSEAFIARIKQLIQHEIRADNARLNQQISRSTDNAR